jgi:spermidine synthase
MSAADYLFDEYDESPKFPRTAAPFICEDGGTISLHFEVGTVQSQMQLATPDLLTIGYTRTMMGFLLFNGRPRHIGMVGLGGGSIPKYCYRFLPHSRISVAEISPEVIALRGNFHIPDDDFRFKVFCEDGADYVPRHSNEFDVLIVDGFDAGGQPEQLCSRRFYDDCRGALAANGIMAVNLCDSRSGILISRMRQSFGNRVVVVEADDGYNKVAFAGKGTALYPPDDQSRRRLASLEHHHPIDLTQAALGIHRKCQMLAALGDDSQEKNAKVVEIR